MNNVAYLNKDALMDKDNPIGYTYDLFSCFAVLIHKENSSLLAHIESNDKDFDVDYKHLLDVLKLGNDEIINVELFSGPYTSLFNLASVSRILDYNEIPYEIKEAFVDIYNKGSIGFDYNTRDYYLVDENHELQKVNLLKKVL